MIGEAEVKMASRRALASIKTAAIFVLLSCLILGSALAAVEPDDGYRVVVKIRPYDAAPAEADDDRLALDQSWATEPLNENLPVPAGLGDFGPCKNTYRLFYTLVPLRKLTGAFVI
jgi:hypothetical protein